MAAMSQRYMVPHSPKVSQPRLSSPQRSPDPSRKFPLYTWSPVPPYPGENLPASRGKHASCMYGGDIYIYGGKDGNFTRKDIWRYKSAEGYWERLTCRGSCPPSPQEHSMVAYKGKLYVFGGEFNYGGDQDTPLWQLDLDTLTWERHRVEGSEVMTPVGRRGHTAVVCNSGMHIYGGHVDLKGSSSELWTFDFEHGMWHLSQSAVSGDDSPGGRHGHSAVMYDGAMYIYGGMNGLQSRDDLWRWHFASCRWSKVKTNKGPPPLKGHSACRLADTMLVFGGSVGVILQADLWSFHFVTQTWSKVSYQGAPPSPRTHHTCVLLLPSMMGAQQPSDRAWSVPQLRPESLLEAGSDPSSTRPFSSPPVVLGCETPRQQVFRKNKVTPSAKRHRVLFQELYHNQDEIEMDIMSSSTMSMQSQSRSMETDTSMVWRDSSNSETSCSECTTPDQDQLLLVGYTGSNCTDSHSKAVYALNDTAAKKQVKSVGYRSKVMFWASSGSLSSTNDELPLLTMRRSRTIEDTTSQGSVSGMDNIAYQRSGSVYGRSGSEEETMVDSYRPAKRHKRQSCYSQFSDDFVPQANAIKAKKSASAESFLSTHSGSTESNQRLGPVGRRILQQKMQDPRSASLDSLLKDFGVVQVDCRQWDLQDITPAGPSSDDLILEDIEDIEDDFLDNSQSELLLHDQNQSKVMLQNQNEGCNKSTLQNAQDHKPASARSVNSSDVSGSHLNSGTQSGQGVVVTNSFQQQLERNIKDAWMDTIANNIATRTRISNSKLSHGNQSDGTVHTASHSQSQSWTHNRDSGPLSNPAKGSAYSGVYTRQCNVYPAISVTETHSRTVIPSTPMARYPGEAMQDTYLLYVLGGQDREATSFMPKPLSIWKLDIIMGSRKKH